MGQSLGREWMPWALPCWDVLDLDDNANRFCTVREIRLKMGMDPPVPRRTTHGQAYSVMACHCLSDKGLHSKLLSMRKGDWPAYESGLHAQDQ